ncbi:hypothetical protein H9L39_10947 [Fusarium oxysporum f. sp. albedinis]|nr:hypothetical protein H9L39_10947 [Fusarium oxysporum f. sp. albedinis]
MGKIIQHFGQLETGAECSIG